MHLRTLTHCHVSCNSLSLPRHVSCQVIVPLYPQFSISTSGSSLRLLQEIFYKNPEIWGPDKVTLPCDHPACAVALRYNKRRIHMPPIFYSL